MVAGADVTALYPGGATLLDAVDAASVALESFFATAKVKNAHEAHERAAHEARASVVAARMDASALPETLYAWAELVASPELRTWVAYSGGVIAGYFELRKQGSDVEILYFGLSPEFIGKGLGRPILEDAITKAWSWKGASRVWVHTCSLDHPAALKNYERRGFKLYKTEKEPLNA